jgi:hypothetical protein
MVELLKKLVLLVLIQAPQHCQLLVHLLVLRLLLLALPLCLLF